MRQIHDALWVHEDSMKIGAVNLPLRMIVVRLQDQSLWVHSPTALTAKLKSEVDELGAVGALVAPNNAHNLWLTEWDSAYPDATTYLAAGIPKKLPNLSGYQILGEASGELWSEDLECEFMAGVPFFCECAFLHPASRSLIVTDLVQNHRGQVHTGLAWMMRKLLLEPVGFKDICLAPPLRFRFMIKDRPAFVAFIRTIQAWDFERIIVAHGEVIEDDAKATLARLCERFGEG